MQLTTLATILSLAAFGAAQFTSVLPCTNGKAFSLRKGLLYALATGCIASARELYSQRAVRRDDPDQRLAPLAARAIKPDVEYEWLEPPQDPDALAWSQNETEWTISQLDALPHTSEILDKIRSLADGGPRLPAYSIAGDKIFRVRITDENPKGFLEVTQKHEDGSLDDWKLVLDMDAIGRAEGKSFEFQGGGTALHNGAALGKDASRYIIGLSEGGGDVIQLREIDVATGQVVSDGFNTGPGRIFFAWLDINHLLISHTATPDSPQTVAGYPAAWQIWERGTPLSEAEEILRVADTSLVAYSFSLGESGRGLLMEFTSSFGMKFHVLSPDGTVKEVTGLPERLVMRFEVEATARHLLVVTGEQATVAGRTVPEGSLLAYDFSSCVRNDDERLSVVWAPGPGEFTPYIALKGLAASRSRVQMTMTSQGVERRLTIEYRNKAWEIIDEVETVAGGMVQIASGDKFSNDIIIIDAGLTHPSVASLVRANGTRTILFEEKEFLKSDDFVVVPLTAESRDGTIIDYVLVSPKSFEQHNSTAGRRPVLMHGYGGFGTSLDMVYLDIHLVPWLEAGGSIVYAFIRGGGEHGTSWQEAAAGPVRRQNSWDDFIAVAEKLIDDGFTSPENLGAYGHSHGGLLVGVMGTQRPDLFGALVSDAPVMDILRFVQMSAAGVAWIPEYGDPANAEDAAAIRTWSPFHLVRDGVDYPPFLITVANTDDNVGTGHSRKMIAKLQDAGAEEAYLYVVAEGGHNHINSYSNPVLMGHRTSFFVHHLMD
ncbi:Alpha/Beta hydrolase protein [Chaetomidium leptoderma]|uniref:Prolyl endopeptidase n=1 Tax=Chaetomidium leptoderma TaxID=669021 RepID=A0AAN6VDQ7_9PEZI|nr:Alpha/Beta hydrolase protein [Chaetomidium leptoderma]